jgi:small subunit ribosomal protein S6
MRAYELAFILRPTLDDEGFTKSVEWLKEQIQAQTGEVTKVDIWGRRTLAYPINNFQEGHYVLVQANMPPDSLLEFERNVKLSEDIIRHMFIKIE